MADYRGLLGIKAVVPDELAKIREMLKPASKPKLASKPKTSKAPPDK
jgi:hypothetical protein